MDKYIKRGQMLNFYSYIYRDPITNIPRYVGKGFGNRAYIHTKNSDNLRFWITTGIGFIPVVGNVISIAVGLLDQFLIDKILPHSGTASFINVLYPSIFKKE